MISYWMIFMPAKRSGGRVSKKLESFNRTEKIYQQLEKGIIESEALLNSAADRPEDDAHIVELLESTSGEQAIRTKQRANIPRQKVARRINASRLKPKKASKGKKRR